MLLIHQVPDGQTINATYYQKVLRRDLMNALRKKRPTIDASAVILHHDNAPAHRAQSTVLEIDVIGFQRISQPPYSPDLAPMDFRVFPEVKSQLRGIRFASKHELTVAAQRSVSSFDADWYRDTFDKWISRHIKCIRVGGDYVEKI
ncbi:histone-lysine N-methyltransferase SETMAR-like [Dreissena polymorpha]|uniref:histone-lysine N-methyltransferase SETMAR-like n=1 Tax=Dreissena polymorpha TaxID=45954 RepID=UPI002263DF98|nr:histone-lysine N-methyltransferase SETMAR-like [Dreissena polymorpha]